MEKIVYSNSFKVSGTYYHVKECSIVSERLFSENPYKGYSDSKIRNLSKKYMKPVYKYNGFIENITKIIPEPSNQYDRNALMVLVDDIFIGYVPEEISQLIAKYFNKNKYCYTTKITINGGPFKHMNPFNEKIEITNKEISFKIDLTIFEKEKISLLKKFLNK